MCSASTFEPYRFTSNTLQGMNWLRYVRFIHINKDGWHIITTPTVKNVKWVKSWYGCCRFLLVIWSLCSRGQKEKEQNRFVARTTIVPLSLWHFTVFMASRNYLKLNWSKRWTPQNAVQLQPIWLTVLFTGCWSGLMLWLHMWHLTLYTSSGLIRFN